MASIDQDWQLTKKTVLERSCHMFDNPVMSDITFTCGKSKRKLYAHKYVLGTSSPVFYSMFYGDLAEKGSEISLPDTDYQSLREFLRFLYTDDCTLTPESAVQILYLSKKYMIPPLDHKCVEKIQTYMKPAKIFTILESAIKFGEKPLETNCWTVVFSHTAQAVASANFKRISKETLDKLLTQNTLNVKEVDLFNAVLKWTDKQCSMNHLEANGENRRAILGEDLCGKLRFSSLSLEEFSQAVVPSGLLTDEEQLLIYERFGGADIPPTVHCTLANSDERVRNLYGMRFPRFWDNVGRFQFVSGRLLKQDDAVSFSVSEKALLHGVRLLGMENGGVYDVMLKVNQEEVNSTHTPENNLEDGYGFDVLLPHPVTINEREVITVSAATIRISGEAPSTHYIYVGNTQRSTVEVNGVTVTFDTPGSGDTKADQIKEIILTRFNVAGIMLAPDWEFF